MIRTKDRFYWSDALYLARARNELVLKEVGPQSEIFQCVHCSAFVRFFKNVAGATSGKWSRIKPYEQFQLQKKFFQPVQIELRQLNGSDFFIFDECSKFINRIKCKLFTIYGK